MLKPLARPPEAVIVDRDGAAYAQAFPEAIVLDREDLCLRRGHLRHSFCGARLFRIACAILGEMPARAEVSTASVMQAAGVERSDDLALHLRQLRRTLRPLGLGVENVRSGRIVVTEPRPEPGALPAREAA